MASAFLFHAPRYRAFDADGAILPGAKLIFYESGTTTPVDTYADAALTTPNSNPVVADAGGEFAPIYLSDAVAYRAILTDADDVEQWDVDPLTAPRDYPAGHIVTFFGDATARDAAYPPALWQVCDGNNGSPDARDAFLVGAGGTYDAGDSGGATSGNTGSAGAHDHGEATGEHQLTENEMPAHHHDLWGDASTAETATQGLGGSQTETVSGRSANVAQSYIENAGEDGQQLVEDTGGDGSHDHTISEDGAHTHSVSLTPPYVAVWYLMRKSS
jgi:hypothetical protein